MAQKRTIDVRFPAGGLNKRLAYQQQSPFHTLDCLNVRLEGTLEKRLRGGSRPGLAKSFSTRDSDNKVRLLTVMRSLNSEGRLTFEENFGGSLTNWDAGAWNDDGLLLVSGGVSGSNAGEDRGAVLKNGVGESGELLSTNNPYTVECWVDASNVVKGGTEASETVLIDLYARLDDTTPDDTSSVRARIRYTLTATLYVARLEVWVDDFLRTFASIQSSGTPLGPGVLRLIIDGDLSIARWTPNPGSSGNTAEVSTDAATASTGKRVGLTADLTPIPRGTDGTVFFDTFRLRYISTSGGVPPEAVVQATNGILRREATDGVLSTVTQANGITLASDRALLAVDRLGKLYIADHGNRLSTDGSEEARQSDGVIASSNSGERLVSGAITDWTDMAVETAGDWLEIIAVGTGSAPNITLAIGLHRLATQSNAGYLELTTGIGNDAEISDITYRVTRGAKVYDSSTDALTIWVPTTGIIPLGCSIIEIFRDRAVMGGDPENPGIYFMCRSGDFDDFNYGASVTDRTRAISDLTTTSDGGQLSIPMSAIAAITEDYCLFSAESELYLLRGDPTLGGIMGNISSQIGIGSRTAWCRIPDGSLVFLSRDGLYRFHPSQPFPENLSREKLPDDLIDVVQNTDLTVTLEYDVRFRGVHIFIVPDTAGSSLHYFFNWGTQSFWPTVLADTDHEPFAMTYNAKSNQVLLGCRDGYIRHHDAAATDDDGTTINSHLFYGPFRLGVDGTRDGAIDSIHVVLDDASGDAVVDVMVGDDPESASKAASFKSRTVSAGRSNRLPARARGVAGFLKISDSSGSRWVIDSLTLVTQRNGKHRG